MAEGTLRVIYMGTPEFAVPALERLADRTDVDVVMVVTQPDRPAGRGRKLVAPPVKDAADRLRLPVMQVPTLRDPDTRQRVVDLAPDLVVVAAFGMILGKWILDMPRLGCVNLHASLLPKYRGANPIAAAIFEGERETGVTLMRMDRGLDTGPMLARSDVSISGNSTTASLTMELAIAAGELLDRSLGGLTAGRLEAVVQPDGATLTRPMTKDDGWLDFSRPAQRLEQQVRAMWPWPRAWTTTADGTRVQVHEASVMTDVSLQPGEIAHHDGVVIVGTGHGELALTRVQLAGGKPIEGAAVRQVKALAEGGWLGRANAPANLAPLVVPAQTAL